MAFLFGSSRRDQIHLLSTLQSLNPTSVAGLAAALSWSERKTERIVREVAGAHESVVAFDPARRTVSIRRAPAATPAPARSGAVASQATVPVAPSPSVPATPPLLPKEFGGTARCPTCQVPLVPTASGEAAVCPECGQLSTRRGRPSAPARGAAEPSSDTATPVPLESGRTVVHSGDRRSQELFAAWVTSRPIPCPRCRTPLRHRGVGEYGCPSCGHRVTFETSVSGIGTPKPSAGPN
ncbi:MAG TPA: hypothetical protein VFG07_00680 [Thermoplasmata archaeon]|nr:hypothetical protein [Thermoplasmata archaeon]